MGFKEAGAETAARIITGSFEQLQSLSDGILSIVQGTDGTTQIATVSGQVHSTVTETVLPALQGVGYAVATLFFLLGLIDLLRNERLTTEMYIKYFINLFAAIFFISYSPELYTTILNFGNALGSKVAEVFELASDAWTIPTREQITTTILERSKLKSDVAGHLDIWGTMFQSFLIGAPVYLICLVLKLVTYMIAFSRLLELAARGTFLPIGFAMITDDGMRGAGGRYLRKFIAICAQVAALVVIAGITTLIFGTIGQGITDNILAADATWDIPDLMGQIVVMVGVGVASISVMFKSIGIINDAFGA